MMPRRPSIGAECFRKNKEGFKIVIQDKAGETEDRAQYA